MLSIFYTLHCDYFSYFCLVIHSLRKHLLSTYDKLDIVLENEDGRGGACPQKQVNSSRRHVARAVTEASTGAVGALGRRPTAWGSGRPLGGDKARAESGTRSSHVGREDGEVFQAPRATCSKA